MIIGIYKIINKENGKYYVGSSQDIEKRFSRHRYELNNNRHHNILLQRAWNKYGENVFEFDIIESFEEISKEDLHKVEETYLVKTNFSASYNINKFASGGDMITNHPEYKKVIANKCKAMQKYLESLSDEERKEKRSKPGAKNPMYGKNHTEESKQKMSENIRKFYDNEYNFNYKKGLTHTEFFGEEKAKEISKKMSKAASLKTGEKNSFYGKHHTEEFKRKASESRIGIYNGKQNIPIIIDDVEYSSLGEASKALDIPITTIRWRVKSKNKKFINYKYKK